jgi:hypothetical protein
LSDRRIYGYRIDIDYARVEGYNGDGVECGNGHRGKVQNSKKVDIA